MWGVMDGRRRFSEDAYDRIMGRGKSCANMVAEALIYLAIQLRKLKVKEATLLALQQKYSIKI